jgi:hypothetical protein
MDRSWTASGASTLADRVLIRKRMCGEPPSEGVWEFQEVMRERFEAVIERAAGRRVIGFMSGNQQHPDIMCEVFILAPTDLVGDHEIPERGRSFGG